jgi:hypothetical protein
VFWFWGFLLFVCLFVLFFPFWRDNDRTSSQKPPGLEDEGLTPTLLRLKLYCIWTWGFSFSFSVLLSSLCLTNVCIDDGWLVHYLSLFISLALFYVHVCVCVSMSVCLFWVFFSLFLFLLCFPSSLTFPL